MGKSMPRTIKGKHVVITGGAGFIGSHLADLLIEEGVGRLTILDNLFLGKPTNLSEARLRMPELRTLQVDVADAIAVREVFLSIERVDVVFDLAAVPLPVSLEQPRFCFETNVQITSVLCELLREKRFGTLVHFSSADVYSSLQGSPMSEEHALGPLTPYAASKVASDHLVSTYTATFGVDALVVRLFNSYGPRQNDRQYAGIVPTILRCAFEGREFRFFGDGFQTRDYLYVADTVRAVLELYLSGARGCVVNIGSGREITMRELKERIERILGCSVPTRYCDVRSGDVRRHVADVTLLRSLIGFEPHVSIDEGLVHTVEFYRQGGGNMQRGEGRGNSQGVPCLS